MPDDEYDELIRGVVKSEPRRGRYDVDSALDLIAHHESGGRNIKQQIVPEGGGYNPSVGRVTGPSSASGPWQITNSTWRKRAPREIAQQYPTAMSAPVEVQRAVAGKIYRETGFQDWAPYNAGLRKAIARGEQPQRRGQQPDDEYSKLIGEVLGGEQATETAPPVAIAPAFPRGTTRGTTRGRATGKPELTGRRPRAQSRITKNTKQETDRWEFAQGQVEASGLGAPPVAMADFLQRDREMVRQGEDQRKAVRQQVRRERMSDAPTLQRRFAQGMRAFGPQGVPILTAVREATTSEDDLVAEEVEKRLASQRLAETPEVVEGRKDFGTQAAPVRALTMPAGRAGAGLVKMLAGLSAFGGIAPNEASEYLNQRASVLEQSASLAPLDEQGQEIQRGLLEKGGGAALDVGFTVAQLAAMKKATGLSLSKIMMLETALRTSDQPVKDRAAAVAQAGVMGRALDVQMGRGAGAAANVVPTLAQEVPAVATGQRDPYDAAINTAVQAGTGALLTSPRRAPVLEPMPEVSTRAAAPSLRPSELAQRTALRTRGEVTNEATRVPEIKPTEQGREGAYAQRAGVARDAAPQARGVKPDAVKVANLDAAQAKGVARETQTEPQPPVQARVEGAEPAEQVAPRVEIPARPEQPIQSTEGIRPPDAVNVRAGGKVPASPPPRHVDLQPRRVRGEGKGQFKGESRAEKETRRQQVNPVQGEAAETPSYARRFEGIDPLALPEWVPLSSGVGKKLHEARSAVDRGKGATVDIAEDWKLLSPARRQEIIARGWVVTTNRMGKPMIGVSRDAIATQKFRSAQMQKALNKSTPPPAQPESAVSSPAAEGGWKPPKGSEKLGSKEPWQMTQREVAEYNQQNSTRRITSEGLEPFGETLPDGTRLFASKTRGQQSPYEIVAESPDGRTYRVGYGNDWGAKSRAIIRLKEKGFDAEWIKARGQRDEHKAAVESAIREGKPVPESVLRDYPDLQAKVTTAPTTATLDGKSYTRRSDGKWVNVEGKPVGGEVLKRINASITPTKPAAPVPTAVTPPLEAAVKATASPARVPPLKPPTTKPPPPVEAVKALPPPSTTSAKKAQMGSDREALDLPELPAAQRKSWRESLEQAKPESANRLADEVLANPRGLNDSETASVVVRAQQVKNEHAAKMAEISAATDADTITKLRGETTALEAEFDKLTQATKASGTEKGRTLAAQKLTINQDYDLVSMVARAKAAKGRDLRPDERVRYEQQSKQISELEAKLAEANDRAQTSQLQKQIDRVKRQTKRGETKQVLDDEFAALRAQFATAKIETRSGVQSSGLAALDPEGKLTVLIAKMARNRVKAGVVEAEKLVDEVYGAISDRVEGLKREDVRDAILGYGFAEGRERTRQTQLLKQETDVSRRLEQRDFSRVERKPPQYTRETYALQKRVDELKANFQRELYRAERGVRGRIHDTTVGAVSIPKTLLSMADLSAVLRQGGVGVYQHPVLSGRAGADMIRSFSERGFANVEAAIKSHRDFELARRSGVEFTGVDKGDPRLSHREEGFFGSDVIDTISRGKFNPLKYTVKPVKDFSERTFVSFLDSQRMRIFAHQAQQLRGMKLTPKELQAALKSQARYINIITGRGSLGRKGNQAAPLLNMAMFSPRLVASRFQLLNKIANPASYAMTPKGARKLQMIDNVKFAAGVVSTLALAKAAGADINLDPDDADFLKMSWGDVRYDTLAGMQQPLRFLYRMAKASVSDPETYAGADKSDIALDFARSKSAPSVGYGWDWMEGKNRLTGKKFEPVKDAARTAIPLPLQDFKEAIDQDGAVKGFVEALPALLGVGVQTYPMSPEKPQTHAEKLARKFIRDKMPDTARTEEEIETSRKASDLRARSRRGEDVAAEIPALNLTDRQTKTIIEAKGVPRFQEDVKRLGVEDVLRVWRVASAAERTIIKPLLADKADAVDQLDESKQAAVKAQLRAIGIKPLEELPPERRQAIINERRLKSREQSRERREKQRGQPRQRLSQGYGY